MRKELASERIKHGRIKQTDSTILSLMPYSRQASATMKLAKLVAVTFVAYLMPPHQGTNFKSDKSQLQKLPFAVKFEK